MKAAAVWLLSGACAVGGMCARPSSFSPRVEYVRHRSLAAAPLCARHPHVRMDLSTFDETSGVVKAVVGSLTAAVNTLFPPKPLTAEEAAARTAWLAERERAPALTLDALLEGLRTDFEQQYLFTGAIDPNLYDDECVFTDPTLSFRGLATFQRNLASLRPVLDALLGETKVDLYSLSLSTEGPSTFAIAKWRMSGGIRLPWRPRIELVGQTRYTVDPTRKGRIVRYDESWQSSAAEQLLALFKPGREFDAADP